MSIGPVESGNKWEFLKEETEEQKSLPSPKHPRLEEEAKSLHGRVQSNKELTFNLKRCKTVDEWADDAEEAKEIQALFQKLNAKPGCFANKGSYYWYMNPQGQIDFIPPKSVKDPVTQKRTYIPDDGKLDAMLGDLPRTDLTLSKSPVAFLNSLPEIKDRAISLTDLVQLSKEPEKLREFAERQFKVIKEEITPKLCAERNGFQPAERTYREKPQMYRYNNVASWPKRQLKNSKEEGEPFDAAQLWGITKNGIKEVDLIACAGPLSLEEVRKRNPDITIDEKNYFDQLGGATHYLRAAFERGSPIIALGSPVEAGIPKYDAYFELGREYEIKPGVFARLKEEPDTKEGVVVREFEVYEKNANGEPNPIGTIPHFQVPEWPDHDPPPEGTIRELKELVADVRNEGMKGPTLIHCSAGVGRTGTFAATEILEREIDRQIEEGVPPDKIMVSPFDVVMLLRWSRDKQCVQRPAQYESIFKIVARRYEQVVQNQ